MFGRNSQIIHKNKLIMEYIVSHRINYEPSGHKSFPDKRFSNKADALDYYNKQRFRCLKKANKIMKEYPELFKSEVMRKDLFQDLTKDLLENHTWWGDIAGFVFHENYAYHSWDLSFEDI